MQDVNHLQHMTGRPPATHIAQLYCDEAELADSVSRFVAEGLLRKEGVWLVATPEHWEMFVERLATNPEIDLSTAIMRGQLRIMNAHHVLAALLGDADGMPQWHRMREGAGDIIGNCRKRFGAVRIYGETADILWRSGKRAAAERMERFWNALSDEYAFTLLCAYSAVDAKERGALLTCVCKTHGRLLPGSGYAEEASAFGTELAGL